MKIVVTYNLKKIDNTKPADYYSEFDSEETINAITLALELKGYSVDTVEFDGGQSFVDYFRKNRIDMVFNIAEGRIGKCRESELTAILDSLNIPYTGSRTFSLALAMNKAVTKKILKAEGIPTPKFQVFIKGDETLNPELRFPLILKPNCEGSSKGINSSNVVNDTRSLYKKVRQLMDLYKQEVLAEEFIEGKELTVGILQNGKVTALPVLEIDFSSCKGSGEYFYSWRMKEYQGDCRLGLTPTFYCPARIDKETEKRVKDIAVKTHFAVGCFGFSRTDIRLGRDNIPYVLEINPLPGLNPRESNFPMMAYAVGMKYEDLIETILLSAQERYGLN
ncbi:MAG: ATP-grasp domain-containing protein [Candidatus Omnitrophica bacterium]|nr:ATP-grasp domain-containing protein [Candidatus Omnitrophota bacterium]